MTPTDQSRIWADASSPPIASLVRGFTAAWRARACAPPIREVTYQTSRIGAHRPSWPCFAPI